MRRVLHMQKELGFKGKGYKSVTHPAKTERDDKGVT